MARTPPFSDSRDASDAPDAPDASDVHDAPGTPEASDAPDARRGRQHADARDAADAADERVARKPHVEAGADTESDPDGANQIEPPPSFLALHVDARRPQVLRTPIGQVRARYELCEDLAGHLAEQARTQPHDDAAEQAALLQRFHAGLSVPEAGLQRGEARWVVTRLAELLEWRVPELGED